MEMRQGFLLTIALMDSTSPRHISFLHLPKQSWWKKQGLRPFIGILGRCSVQPCLNLSLILCKSSANSQGKGFLFSQNVWEVPLCTKYPELCTYKNVFVPPFAEPPKHHSEIAARVTVCFEHCCHRKWVLTVTICILTERYIQKNKRRSVKYGVFLVLCTTARYYFQKKHHLTVPVTVIQSSPACGGNSTNSSANVRVQQVPPHGCAFVPARPRYCCTRFSRLPHDNAPVAVFIQKSVAIF